MLIATGARSDGIVRSAALARMLADPAVPIAVESALLPAALRTGQLRLGLGAPLTPLRLPASPPASPAAPAAPRQALDGFDAGVKVGGLTLKLSTHALGTYLPKAMDQAAPTLDCVQVILGGGSLYSTYTRKGVSWETGVSAVAFAADLVAALGHVHPVIAVAAPHAKLVSLVFKTADGMREMHAKLN